MQIDPTMLKVVTASAAVVLAAVMFACSGGSGTIGGSSGGSSGSSTPVENGHVTSSAGMNVEATISAATLGDECGGGGQTESKFAPSGDCAPQDGGTCGGGSFCQQSNVQIAFNSGDGQGSAKIQIVSVTLHDANDGSQIDELDASNPQKWSSSGGYTAWDQTIAPKTELKASYSLSAPAWSTMSDQSYSRKFRLHVTVTIDGSTVVLQSAVLSREPAVAT